MKDHATIIALVFLCTLAVIGLTLYLWHGEALQAWLWCKRSNIRINQHKR